MRRTLLLAVTGLLAMLLVGSAFFSGGLVHTQYSTLRPLPSTLKENKAGPSLPAPAPTPAMAGASAPERLLNSGEAPSAPAPGDALLAETRPAADAPALSVGGGPAAAGAGSGRDGAASGKPSLSLSPVPPGAGGTSGGAGASGLIKSPHQATQAQLPPITAGKVDDNAAFGDYLDYLANYDGPPAHPVDVRQRLFLRVVDNSQHPVAGARVQLFDGDRRVFDGETVSDGSVLFFPAAAGAEQARDFRAVVSRGQAATEAAGIKPGTQPAEVVLKAADNTGPVYLDLVFLLDSTGSMQDEIDRIKLTVDSIATRIEQLPGSATPRLGLVTYRDRGDDYITRSWDFTNSVETFKVNLANVFAGGGGDTPESVNEALHDAIHLPGWAANSTGKHLRMIVLVGDAPPHLDYANDYEYTSLLNEAVAAGIKVFPIGASNLDDQGEYIFRQFAQITQGQFVFLTYANGISGAPGMATDKHVSNYTVSDLDSLVVGLVAGEIANQTGKQASYADPAPVAAPVAVEQPPSRSVPGLVSGLASLASKWLAEGASWLVVLGLPLVYLAAWLKRRGDIRREVTALPFRLAPAGELPPAAVETRAVGALYNEGLEYGGWEVEPEGSGYRAALQDTIALPNLPREIEETIGIRAAR